MKTNKTFEQTDFLIGASTAAHQVEGNNVHSDCWAQELMKNSSFIEPSLDAADHYNRYQDDIELMSKAGLNAYRFSFEWARIEPENGKFDDNEIEHYRKVLTCCHESGIKPIVTMHHFSSPKWLISEGGWEAESTVSYFKRYCGYVVEKLGDQMEYVCTINEANMGLQMAAIIRRIMKQAGVNLQVGMNYKPSGKQLDAMLESADIFGIDDPNKVYTFLSQRTKEGDVIIMHAHEAARNAMKAKCPHLKVGVTLSLHDIQSLSGGEEQAQKEWENEFLHYLPYIKNDDFLGVQNYTREIIGAEGIMPVPEGNELTQMGYEYYPEALANVIRKVREEVSIPILVTENGLATTDDTRRIAFIDRVLDGVKDCMKDGINVLGYLHWSLLDNFEWQKGYSMTFGLIAVDRSVQVRHPKPSLYHLGKALTDWKI